MKKNNNFIESPSYEFFRDFSGLGNPGILLAIIYLAAGFEYLKSLFFGLILIEIFGNLIKLLFFKKRPNNQSYRNLYEKSLASSFPSLHVARIFYFCLLFFNPSNLLNIFFSVFIIFLVGYSRIYLKKHYFIDLVGGIVLSLSIYILLSLS